MIVDLDCQDVTIKTFVSILLSVTLFLSHDSHHKQLFSKKSNKKWSSTAWQHEFALIIAVISAFSIRSNIQFYFSVCFTLIDKFGAVFPTSHHQGCCLLGCAWTDLLQCSFWQINTFAESSWVFFFSSQSVSLSRTITF